MKPNISFKKLFALKKYYKLFLVATVFSLLILEIVLRVVWGFGSPPLMQSDPEVGYLFQRNQNLVRFGNRVKINNFHQRSDDINPDPENGALRILCLGDSVTWGGVLTDQAETYPEILSKLLKQSLEPKKIEVINASAGSWGIGNELAYLEKFGTFKSAVVVHQINSEDFLQQASTGEKIGLDPMMPAKNPPFAIWEVIFRYGPKWNFFNTQTAPNIETKPISAEDVFQKNLEDLTAIDKICKSNNAKLIVLLTPLREEVLAPETPKKITFGKLHNRFELFCKEKQIETISFKSDWQKDAESVSYFRDSIHPNPLGNAKIASIVKNSIISLNIQPRTNTPEK